MNEDLRTKKSFASDTPAGHYNVMPEASDIQGIFVVIVLWFRVFDWIPFFKGMTSLYLVQRRACSGLC